MYYRYQIFLLLDDPHSSVAAAVLTLSICALILLSVVLFCVETLPEFYGKHQYFWEFTEGAVVILFTLEFTLRFSTCPNVLHFLKDPLNFVDFLSIFPFYVLIFVDILSLRYFSNLGSLALIRVIRLTRILRVLKVSRYATGFMLVVSALKKSKEALFLLLFLALITVTIFSALEYFAERGTYNESSRTWIRSDGTPSPFNSIPACFWWAIVTLTTVGYGDMVPITIPGKCIASACMVVGVLGIAFPITIIGTNFAEEWERLKEAKRREDKQHITMSPSTSLHGDANGGFTENENRMGTPTPRDLATKIPPVHLPLSPHSNIVQVQHPSLNETFQCRLTISATIQDLLHASCTHWGLRPDQMELRDATGVAWMGSSTIRDILMEDHSAAWICVPKSKPQRSLLAATAS